jgi:hypothetical protein
MKWIAFLLVTSVCFALFGQTDTYASISADEQRLMELLSDLRNQKEDAKLKEANDTFKSVLKEVLQKDEAFNHPFQALTSVGKIYSQDQEVRVITWNVQWNDGTNSYFGFVMKKKRRKDTHHTSELHQYPKGIYPKYNRETLEPSQWYGCLYYDIVDVQNGNKTYYTLLGYDAYDSRSKMKILDIMFFAGNTPRFGYPMFETKQGLEKRIYMEHSAKATMSMKYDRKRKMIIFDHLSPEAPNLHEFREYYVPDMSYDAYRFEEGKWRLIEDIVAINEKDHEVKVMTYDSDRDTSVVLDNQNRWNDPTNKNAPIDGGTHRAVKPEDIPEEKQSASKEKKKKKQKDKGFSGVKYSPYSKED